MAPKSKSKSKPAPAKSAKQTAAQKRQLELIVISVQVVVLLSLAAIYSPISQLSLSPVYGAIPACFFHQKAITFTALVGFISKDVFRRFSPKNPRPIIAILAFWIPTIQFLLCQFSAQLGPTYGPLIIELLTYFPLLLLTAFSAAQLLEKLDLSAHGATLAELGPPAASYLAFSFAEKAFSFFLPQIVGVGTPYLVNRINLQLIVAFAYTALAPSPLVALGLPALIHTVGFNPHFNAPHTTWALNNTLHAHNFSLVERRESLTGYVSVIESLNDQIQFMRCDHTLLGGEWLITPERQAKGQVDRETIYHVFSMLDAVRLIQTGDKRSESDKTALVIGLGIGTSPKSLISQGINTTIIELDPAIHYMATKYFGLPPEHIAVIDNAIPWVTKTSETHPKTYDYIVHDVFTGGAEPAALFTLEFLQGLSDLLTEKGTIAINYASDLALPQGNLVLNTIHAVFPACRVYRDNPPTEESSDTDFINMVVFCTKRAPPGGVIEFRSPTAKDIGGSLSRSSWLPPSSDLEVNFDYPTNAEARKSRPIMSQVDTRDVDANNADTALSHWKIMRTVIPDAVWELW